MRLPGRVTVSSTSKRVNEQVALVRDVSSHGLFFFADLDLQKGEHISLILEYLRSSERIRLELTGTVVRIEKPTNDATAGIAVRFDSPLKEIPGLH